MGQDDRMAASLRRVTAQRERLNQSIQEAEGIMVRQGREIRDLKGQLGEASSAQRTAQLGVREPTTYAKDSPHSFFADMARVGTGLGDQRAARRRLDRHQDELAVIYPPWREARKRAAESAYEAAFAGDRRGQELLERMDQMGMARFAGEDAFGKRLTEQRAADTTQGSGGYFTPPMWLMEDWASAARAGRGFADLWRGLPLPSGCHSVNVPKWLTGIGAGPATDGATLPSDAPADSYATSVVETTAGTQLVSMPFAEQVAPPGYDAFVFADLMADIGNSLDVQLLIGSGASGQLKGIIPSGVVSAADLVTVANSNAVAGQTLTVVSAGSPVWRSVTRLLSLMTRARGLPPTHVAVHPSTYFQVAGTIDSTGRPLVPPGATPPGGSPAVVQLWGMPALLDDNLPVTFGGATAPSVATVGGGITATSPGDGTWAVVTAIRSPDLFLFEGEMRTRVARDIAQSTGLQWRFVAHQYTAALRDRYASASGLTASAETDTGAVNAGGATSAGVMTHYQANSPLQPAADGF